MSEPVKRQKQPRKPLKIERLKAESPQVDDEGMLGRIRKVRIVGIEDNNGKKDRKGNPIQNVYFYRDLADSGEADWRIHTDSEQEHFPDSSPIKGQNPSVPETPSYMADSDAHKLMEASWRINSFVESGEEYPEWWRALDFPLLPPLLMIWLIIFLTLCRTITMQNLSTLQ